MRAVLVDLCLAASVAAAWLGCLSVWRLRTALDRLHAVTFVTVVAGNALAAAAFAQDGVTTRSLKLAALVLVLILAGAVSTHAVGRAILLRDGPQR